MTVTDAATTPTGLTVGDATTSGLTVQVWAAGTPGESFPVAESFLPPNQTVFLPLPAGPYFVTGIDPNSGAMGTAFFVRATDGRATPPTRSRAAVADRIRSLVLPVPAGLGRGWSVAELWNTSDVDNLEYPVVMLSVEGVSESDESTMSSVDDIGFPVRVTLCDRADQWDANSLPDYEAVRWLIDRAFRNQQIPGVPESVRCKIEYDPIGNPNLPKFEYTVSEFVIRHVLRLYRGIF
jgi:hypothetical protein